MKRPELTNWHDGLDAFADAFWIILIVLWAIAGLLGLSFVAVRFGPMIWGWLTSLTFTIPHWCILGITVLGIILYIIGLCNDGATPVYIAGLIYTVIFGVFAFLAVSWLPVTNASFVVCSIFAELVLSLIFSAIMDTDTVVVTLIGCIVGDVIGCLICGILSWSAGEESAMQVFFWFSLIVNFFFTTRSVFADI